MKTYFQLREDLNTNQLEEGKIGKAIGKTIGGVVGAGAGALGGGTAGGLVAPGIGNMAGFTAGGLAGGSLGSNIGGRIGDAITGDGKRGERAVNLIGKGVKGIGKAAVKGIKSIAQPKVSPVPSSIIHPKHGQEMIHPTTGNKYLRGIDGKPTNISATHPDVELHRKKIQRIGTQIAAKYRLNNKPIPKPPGRIQYAKAAITGKKP